MAAASRAMLSPEITSSADQVRDTKATQVRKLLSEGLTLEQISRTTGLSEAEIRKLMDEGRAI